MRIAYLDCFSGAAGDMLVGACLDAGVALEELESELARLNLENCRVDVQKVRRQSIAGTHFRVVVSHPEEGHPHRHLPEINSIIRAAGYPSALETRMLDAFRVLAEAEASAHAMPVEDVHFHEVGAHDAIMDVCGAVLAFDMLGVEKVYASEIVVGQGVVACAHGTMPVPAPGTLNLLKGIPVRAGHLQGERCTPTGAALLCTLVDEFCVPVSYRPVAIGYGAGTRDDAPVPNLLRVTVGEVADARGADLVWELALQVDNVSGEVLGHALRAAIAAGALDAWVTPTLTKKNRPAHWVMVLADDVHRDALEVLLLSELPTLGLRRNQVERRTLPRRVETRETALGAVQFKVRTLPDGTEIASPESNDVERLAKEHGLSVPSVLARIGGHT